MLERCSAAAEWFAVEVAHLPPGGIELPDVLLQTREGSLGEVLAAAEATLRRPEPG